MTDNEYTVILVPSTSHAIRVEKILGGAHISCKLVPVPRISVGLRVCVRILRRDKDRALCAIPSLPGGF